MDLTTAVVRLDSGRHLRHRRARLFARTRIMTTVHDVAAYVLRARGPLTAMKLQKLVYYSQAWSLAVNGRPLFPERARAWANGPGLYELFDRHRRQLVLSHWEGGPEALAPSAPPLIARGLAA